MLTCEDVHSDGVLKGVCWAAGVHARVVWTGTPHHQLTEAASAQLGPY